MHFVIHVEIIVIAVKQNRIKSFGKYFIHHDLCIFLFKNFILLFLL